MIGRFKRFGALINQGSHRCLARNTNRRSASFAAANQAIVAQRCDEVAGVHRGMQGRVVDAIRAVGGTRTMVSCHQVGNHLYRVVLLDVVVLVSC